MAELPPVESPTVSAVYGALVHARRDEDRGYLGMSQFGTECDRALWYGWRKAYDPEALDGRRIRLFETGHLEESRLIADLERAGMIVSANDWRTGRQFAVWSLGGHLRGHLDGKVERVPDAPRTTHVLECKTHNDKSFRELLKDGVAKSKPGHFAQMQFYMHFTSLTRALYVAVNKNDDQLYAERVRYDAAAALQLVARAERIVRAERPPAKLHADPSAREAYACGWCPARKVCHEGAWARVNCRTCLHATPVVDEGDAGRWHCARYDLNLTPDEQRRGCPSHRYVPDLVPGEQLDVDEEGETISYRLADGSLWTDGAGAAGWRP
ncbi:PD-(D/E)XK nuclease family protein [Methylobacterium sp. WSM2598]|uniref:PD-(D/E)XK nuclease family protein n=1 Tax=Methylobacterium sp. WSM2598 TaxID=398261 RepID=UPI000369B6F5|nr:PD-(D/E)XK nuclease family protein [Methylobacterium sp. WSM2598]